MEKGQVHESVNLYDRGKAYDIEAPAVRHSYDVVVVVKVDT